MILILLVPAEISLEWWTVLCRHCSALPAETVTVRCEVPLQIHPTGNPPERGIICIYLYFLCGKKRLTKFLYSLWTT